MIGTFPVYGQCCDNINNYYLCMMKLIQFRCLSIVYNILYYAYSHIGTRDYRGGQQTMGKTKISVQQITFSAS